MIKEGQERKNYHVLSLAFLGLLAECPFHTGILYFTGLKLIIKLWDFTGLGEMINDMLL